MAATIIRLQLVLPLAEQRISVEAHHFMRSLANTADAKTADDTVVYR
jgi:hypothetical protein